MDTRRLSGLLGITLLCLCMAACAAGSTSADQNSSAQSEKSTPQTLVPGNVVEVTPLSETEMAAQPPQQAAPGASEGKADDETPTVGADLKTYTENTYQFQLAYPSDFVLASETAEKLEKLHPQPSASFTFINPILAAGDNAELEAADLEIRVYPMTSAETLEQWLTAAGLLPADGSVKPKPFQSQNAVGLEVCASTLIAPGCSYFIMGSQWVYQLTPASLEGEAMIGTWAVMP